MKNNLGLYSSEHKKFLQYIMSNSKISINSVDRNTIKLVDKYIKELDSISLDIFEESIKFRIKDIDLDLSSYIGTTISVASLEAAVFPILSKYISNILMLKYIVNGFEVITALFIVYLIVKIRYFYKIRKEELLFNNFVLDRIKKIYK